MLNRDNLFTIIFVNILLSIVITLEKDGQTAQTLGVVACFIVYTSRDFNFHFFFWSKSPKKNFRFEDTSQNWFERGAGRAKQSAAAESYPHPPAWQVEVKQLVYLLTIYGHRYIPSLQMK